MKAGGEPTPEMEAAYKVLTEEQKQKLAEMLMEAGQ